MRSRLLTLILGAACAAPPPAPAPEPPSMAPSEEDEEPTFDTTSWIRTMVAGQHRSAENKARDQYRHPAETLAFFGLRPELRVIELRPGRGWYTEILAPLLASQGKLTVAQVAFAPSKLPEGITQEQVKASLVKDASEWGAKFKERHPVFASVETMGMTREAVNLGAPGSADMVVTFRNMHSYIRRDFDTPVLAAVFEVLRPGGIFGVVQHRAKADVEDARASAEFGYVPEAYIVEIVEAAGFKLAAKAEINANPRDTKDYEKGVWTLPPSLTLKEQDRDKYTSIGESDRMTLRFTKPATFGGSR